MSRLRPDFSGNAPVALISVGDTTGLIEIARKLYTKGYKLVATRATAQYIRSCSGTVFDLQLPVQDLGEFTRLDFKEDSRPTFSQGLYIKDLSPELAALAKRYFLHRQKIKTFGYSEDIELLSLFDVMIINLQDIVDNFSSKNTNSPIMVDMGGVTLLRSLIGDDTYPLVLTSPSEYLEIDKYIDLHRCGAPIELPSDIKSHYLLNSLRHVRDYTIKTQKVYEQLMGAESLPVSPKRRPFVTLASDERQTEVKEHALGVKRAKTYSVGEKDQLTKTSLDQEVELLTMALAGTNSASSYNETEFPRSLGRLLNIKLLVNLPKPNKQPHLTARSTLFTPYSEIVKLLYLTDDKPEKSAVLNKIIDVGMTQPSVLGPVEKSTGLSSPWNMFKPIINELYQRLNSDNNSTREVNSFCDNTNEESEIPKNFFSSIYNTRKFHSALRLTALGYLERSLKANIIQKYDYPGEFYKVVSEFADQICPSLQPLETETFKWSRLYYLLRCGAYDMAIRYGRELPPNSDDESAPLMVYYNRRKPFVDFLEKFFIISPTSPLSEEEKSTLESMRKQWRLMAPNPKISISLFANELFAIMLRAGIDKPAGFDSELKLDADANESIELGLTLEDILWGKLHIARDSKQNSKVSDCGDKNTFSASSPSPRGPGMTNINSNFVAQTADIHPKTLQEARPDTGCLTELRKWVLCSDLRGLRVNMSAILFLLGLFEELIKTLTGCNSNKREQNENTCFVSALHLAISLCHLGLLRVPKTFQPSLLLLPAISNTNGQLMINLYGLTIRVLDQECPIPNLANLETSYAPLHKALEIHLAYMAMLITYLPDPSYFYQIRGHIQTKLYIHQHLPVDQRSALYSSLFGEFPLSSNKGLLVEHSKLAKLNVNSTFLKDSIHRVLAFELVNGNQLCSEKLLARLGDFEACHLLIANQLSSLLNSLVLISPSPRAIKYMYNHYSESDINGLSDGGLIEQEQLASTLPQIPFCNPLNQIQLELGNIGARLTTYAQFALRSTSSDDDGNTHALQGMPVQKETLEFISGLTDMVKFVLCFYKQDTLGCYDVLFRLPILLPFQSDAETGTLKDIAIILDQVRSSPSWVRRSFAPLLMLILEFAKQELRRLGYFRSFNSQLEAIEQSAPFASKLIRITRDIQLMANHHMDIDAIISGTCNYDKDVDESDSDSNCSQHQRAGLRASTHAFSLRPGSLPAPNDTKSIVLIPENFAREIRCMKFIMLLPLSRAP